MKIIFLIVKIGAIRMECIKGNLKIKLEEDKEKMKKEIKELDKLLEILEKNPQQCLLAGKTQLIGKEGNGKRSRQEHSNNLRNIAKQIIDQIYDEVVPTKIKESELYNLNLQIAEKYIEVMSITHDIGHTPYGHLGERVLNEFVSGQQISQKDTKTILEKIRKIFGDKYVKRQRFYKTVMLVILTVFLTFIFTTIYITNKYGLGDGDQTIPSLFGTSSSSDDKLTKSLKNTRTQRKIRIFLRKSHENSPFAHRNTPV